MKPDYRLETQKFMKEIKIEKLQFCSMFGITPNTYTNWLDGNTSPSTSQFERLKKLVHGESRPPTSDPPKSEEVSELIGQIKLLTGLIKTCQETLAVLRSDYDRSMLDGEKKITTIAAEVESIKDRLSGGTGEEKRRAS
ncbi:MAG: hypothetical protein KW806_02945 [Candidatus Yanofskybacteria bacterium]|nr:hypothetical protein [Candidatus Yanofskybacteria bacterium]